MKNLTICILLVINFYSFASNDKYRLTLRDNPSSSIVVGWNQISGNNATVYYGTTDYGTDYQRYPNFKAPQRIVNYKGMNNQFARLTGLSANTSYYFVIRDSQGVSQRMWFKTAPNDNSRLSFIAGGDSRNNRAPRQNANRLVSKLKPHAVLFGGDMTSDDTDSQWRSWFDDWQLTKATDGRMFPIIAARGNHEGSNNSIYHLFDVPSSNVYFGITFGRNLIRTYTLNSEISISGDQTAWLDNDLSSSNGVIWKMAQYHKPMRPHVSFKSEGNNQYNNWAQLFYDKGVRLVVECDAHTVKSTWPIRPSNGSDSDEGFVRDDANGTVYAGEGCWGAPLRGNDDAKSWTRDSGRFNQFKWIFVDDKKIETRTIKVDNAGDVSAVSNTNVFRIPNNLDIWNPSNGSVVTITKEGEGTTALPLAGTLTIPITSGNDDVEEDKDGNLYTDSSDLELMYDYTNNESFQTVGLRFRNVRIPQGSVITNAYIQFYADESNSDTSTELEFSLHRATNSGAFSSSSNVSSRAVFSNKVRWRPGAWSSEESNSNQRTPNLKGLVQSLVDQSGWNPGNSLSVVIKGIGSSLTNSSSKRVADSFEGGSNKAPKLIVSYVKTNTQEPFKNHSIPGTIEAEDFDIGGQGIAYNDTDPQENIGGFGRTDQGVDQERATDNGNGINVGWIADGEWLNYTIANSVAGKYNITFRVASDNTISKQINAKLGNSQLGRVSIPNTGGWQSWQDVTLENVNLTGGPQVLRLDFVGGYFNLNWVRFSPTNSTEYTIRAKGVTGEEQLRLAINNETIQRFNITRSWANYTVATASNGTIRVHFDNDDTGRDLEIDYVRRNNVVYQAENQAINTSAWMNGECGGGSYTQWMHCPGYIEFAQTGGKSNAQNLLSELKVYPNPFDDYIVLELDNSQTQSLDVSIYDLNGKQIYQNKRSAQQGNNVRLNPNIAQSGIYIMKVWSGGQLLKVQQLIKN